MIDFYNNNLSLTKKSKNELIKSLILFKLIQNKTIFKLMSFILLLFLKIRIPFLKFLIKNTIYKQFCGGENIHQCKIIITKLQKENIQTSLDFVVENKQKKEDFKRYFKELELIIATQNNIKFIVIKISALLSTELLIKLNHNQEITYRENKEVNKLKLKIEKICKSAKDKKIKILFDAEESWIQNYIDYIVMKIMLKFNIKNCWVYNTVQMYRWDRLTYLKNALNEALEKKFLLGVKLVRGAYLEKERKSALKYNYECPIHKTKNNTDRDFNQAISFIIQNIKHIYLFFGTHNEESTNHLVTIMKKNKIKSNDQRIIISQLYGMGDHITYTLKEKNFNVVKYMPYGPIFEAIPYLIRRLRENSSISNQSNRELNLIFNEIKKRKNLSVKP